MKPQHPLGMKFSDINHLRLMTTITDKDFTLRCCWACKHCELDILRGYECNANPNLPPIPLGGNVEIHKNRDNCKAYIRG